MSEPMHEAYLPVIEDGRGIFPWLQRPENVLTGLTTWPGYRPSSRVVRPMALGFATNEILGLITYDPLEARGNPG